MTPHRVVWHHGIYDTDLTTLLHGRSHLMGFIARSYDTSTTFTDTQALDALERVVSADAIRAAAIVAVPTQRRRKLPADVTLRRRRTG